MHLSREMGPGVLRRGHGPAWFGGTARFQAEGLERIDLMIQIVDGGRVFAPGRLLRLVHHADIVHLILRGCKPRRVLPAGDGLNVL